MGDEEGGGRHRPAQAVEDRALDPRIDRRGRVVEEEDSWFCEQRSGQREALALAAREGHATLADDVVEPAGQALHERQGPGDLEGVANLVDRKSTRLNSSH